ncbi:class I SAM-dependent methyltransferase [Mycobacterium riyadhense]|uniref:Demethylrebeccamycin-D-glucose O-methyltransferase n=2 Tax=Mycobacterium riyadhense TaxID=486698 RepID=A0A653EK68_9MYCO|nr:class I SAM-dependent methyltransferase [Mycobacterium riyadhense]VTO97260.1 Demethylrebeccamycin-D-glucose O-methyltransferase [Mycobacterium riyadhense]
MIALQRFFTEDRRRLERRADWRRAARRAQATLIPWSPRVLGKRLESQAQMLGDHINRGDTVLDVGCETGHLCKYLADMHGATATGIDVHDARTIPIDFSVFDGRSIPFEDNAFDHVVLSFVLHHCNDPMALIKECRRVARRSIIAFEDLPETRVEKMLTRMHIGLFRVAYRLESAGDYRTALKWLDEHAAEVSETPLPLDWFDVLYRVPHVMLIHKLAND